MPCSKHGALAGLFAQVLLSAQDVQMFKSKYAAQLWRELMDATKTAPSIPPCQTSDPDAWFPEQSHTDPYANTQSYYLAKKLCDQCPVKAQCLAYALANEEEFGMWGGTTPRQRQAMRDRRAAGRPRKQA